MSRGKLYTYPCKDIKENPELIVRWLRKNMGHRGVGWDFYLTSGNITVEIWDSKLQLMWEMWKE